MSSWLAKFKRRRRYRSSTNPGWTGISPAWNRAKVLRALSLVMLASVVGGLFLLTVLFVWFSRDLPSPDRVVRDEGFSTKIFSRGGDELYDVYGDQRRTPTNFESIPEDLRNATVAVEDKDFYKHGGYDPKGITRAFLVILFQGRLQGGSTLTQQLVKNVLLSSERTLPRKIKEFVLAVQIERKFNKDQILTMYLNEAPYGGTAWGVATAAQVYFGKDVSELDLVESAILAGLPQRPTYYSPFGPEPDAYIARATHVLRRMREDGYISKEDEEGAVEALDDVKFASSAVGIKAPHFVFYVIDQLEELFGERLVEQGGLKVTTTLDLPLQEAAQEIVAEEVEGVADLAVGNGAAMALDPNSGEILSMVGSKDFHNQDEDGQVNVTLSLRQPGSSIKPVTYALALEEGFTPASMIMDTRTEFPGGVGNPPYVPVNYDGKYRGPVSLRRALGSSLNIPAVKVLAQVGIENMLKLAYDMGFTTLEPTKENMRRFGLSVTLGGGEVRLIDMVSAYSVFANGGTKVEPVAILKVEDRDGKVLYEHKQVPGERVIEEGTAFLMDDILSDNEARQLTFGPNSYLNMSGRPIAVKTGTTNDRRDNWTVGWSSSVVIGVWVGNNDNSPMKGVASGVTGASPIWRRIILEALKERPARTFEVPPGVDSVFVDALSGYPEHDGFPSRSEYVLSGTLPRLPDPIHAKLKLCRGQERLATAGQIANGDYEEKEYFVFRENDPFAGEGEENRWQKGIDEWLATQGDGRYHPPTDQCEGGTAAAVRINNPEHQHNYDGDKIEVDMSVFSDKKIEKVDILIDGSKRETLTSKPYKTELTLSPGSYELQGRAMLEGGEVISSGNLRFGIGGIDWDTPDPTPTPSPSPTPAPTPTPT